MNGQRPVDQDPILCLKLKKVINGLKRFYWAILVKMFLGARDKKPSYLFRLLFGPIKRKLVFSFQLIKITAFFPMSIVFPSMTSLIYNLLFVRSLIILIALLL